MKAKTIRSTIESILSLVSTGTALYLSTGFHNLWWLLWIAPIPVLIYAYHHSFLNALCVTFLASLALGSHDIFGYWPSVTLDSKFIVFALWQSLEWTAVILFSNYLMKHIRSPFSIFSYPICLLLFECLMSVPVHTVPNSISYSQLSHLSILQVVSGLWLYEVSFIFALGASALAYGIIFWRQKKQVFLALFIELLVVGTGIFYYHYWMQAINTIDNKMFQARSKISVTFNILDVSSKVSNAALAPEIFARYQVFIRFLTAAGGAEPERAVALIMLPKESFNIDAAIINEHRTAFSKIAQQDHITLMIDAHDKSHPNARDAVWVFNENGLWLGEYHQRHFVPNIETGPISAHTALLFTLSNNLADVGLCSNDAYPPWGGFGFFAGIGRQIFFWSAWDLAVDQKEWVSGVNQCFIDWFFDVKESTGAFNLL